MAGLAATERCALVVDRDALDTQDIFRALRSDTGDELWSLTEPASGQLDFGNAPRATPQIFGDLVFFYNAFGTLVCARLENGQLQWKKNLLEEFGGRDDQNAWGTTSSPLVVDDKVIVNPGAAKASLVALNPKTGAVLWKTPGDKAAFGSLIVGTFGGRRQIVGLDKHALCGWDIATGKRLWRVEPPRSNDFNVATPIAAGEMLLVSTENNGTRMFRFDKDGIIIPQPAAIDEDLAPETQTPVAVETRLFGVWRGLHCLDLANGLKPLWKADDKAFDDYASIIACGNRVLILSKHGELLLVDAKADHYKLISRLKVFDDDPGVYSHPALIGKHLFVRGSEEIVCLNLESPKE